MKLWMSSEFSGEIGNSLRSARNFVEDEINKKISSSTYGIELDDWDCITIIMEDSSNFEEVMKYSKKKRDMDFRLKINFNEFVSANALEQQKLIYQMLQRSLDILLKKGADESGVNALRTDIELVAKENAWELKGSE